MEDQKEEHRKKIQKDLREFKSNNTDTIGAIYPCINRPSFLISDFKNLLIEVYSDRLAFFDPDLLPSTAHRQCNDSSALGSGSQSKLSSGKKNGNVRMPCTM